MIRLPLLFVLLMLLATAASAQGETRIYKWVDEDGVTHYTQQPPPEGEAVVVDPDTGTGSRARPSPPAESAGDNRGGGDEAAASASDTETIEDYCERLRERVALLAGDEPVRLREDDTIVTLDDDARAERRGRLESQIAEHCEG